MKYFKNKYFLTVLILFILAVIKLYHLDGGFVLGEPDERNYVKVVANFSLSPLPNFDGEDFFHSPPLFHYFSFLLSLIVTSKYTALRIVSLIFSFLLGLSIYFYLKNKVAALTAVFGGVLFSLIPLGVYYSRLGLIEMQLSFFTFLYVILLEKSWSNKSKKWSVLTGLILGLGLLTKYSLLPLVGLPVILLGFDFLTDLIKKRNLTYVLSPEFRNKLYKLLTIYISAFLVFAPVTYFNYSLGPIEFKSQLHQDFGLSKRVFEISVVKEYLTTLPSFLGLATILLFILGLIPLFMKFKKNLSIISTICLLSFVIARISIYQPRYLMIIIPLVLVVSALGMDELFKRLKGAGLYTKEIGLVLIMTVLFTLIPGYFKAVEASRHTIIEEVGKFIAVENKSNQWVTTNYWPSAFVDEVGYKITWYSSNQSDAAGPSGGGKTKYIYPDKATTEIINKEGGWVIVENRYSREISKNPERKNPVTELVTTQTPIKVFTESQPNWPFYPDGDIKISVYHLNPK